MKTSSNKFIWGGIPLSGIILLYFFIPHVQQLPTEIIDKLPYAPYLIFLVATAMGVFFNRHRTSLIAISLAITYAILHSAFTSPEFVTENLLTLSIASILLPLNLAFISSIRDQQILSTPAFIACTIILIQVVTCYWLIKNQPSILVDWLFLESQFSSTSSPNNGLPIVGILTYTAGILWLAKQVLQKDSVFEIAFIGSLIASSFALQTNTDQLASSAYMLLAGLILIWGIAHNSYLIAYIDELTKLPGRRAMNEEMARLRGNYAIAMLDIDHFKKFNDSYGHEVGDQVLRMVAGKVSKVHGGGKPFRYGGEEFTILFPGKDSKAAFPFLSNLREAIDSTRMVLRNHNRPKTKPDNSPARKAPWQEVHVTISIGVASNTDDKLTSMTEVLKAADEALYHSKAKGRNRISQHGTTIRNLP